jgi:tetratricopeptide (TPR) repeat protein
MSLHFTILFTLLILSSLVSTTTNFLYLPQQTMAQIDDNGDEDSQTITTTSDLTTYENSTYGVKIQYPSDWSIDEVDPDPEDRATHVVTFWAPYETPEDTYQERVSLLIDNIPYRADLAEYLQESINAYKVNEDFEIVESNPDAKLAGNPAYLLTYTWTTEPENEDELSYNLQTMEIGTIIENKGYYITYNAEEDAYSDYLPTIQNMIDSFEILSVSSSATFSSDEAITLYNKGLDATNLGNYDEAIQYYDRSLAIDPNNVNALNEKGLTLVALGRHKEAIEYYDRALQISPNDAVILDNKDLALAAINNGQGIDTQSRIPIQEEGNQTDVGPSVGGFLKYQNSSLGITMQYPSNWQQEPGDSNSIVRYFISPQESNNDVLADLFYISVYNSENTPLDENVATMLNSLSQTLSDFTPIESNPTTLAGNPAHRLVYGYTDPEIGALQEMQVLTVKDDILYTFTYLAEQSKYLKYLPTALDMLKSIEIGASTSDDGSGGVQENAPPAELRPF